MGVRTWQGCRAARLAARPPRHLGVSGHQQRHSRRARFFTCGTHSGDEARWGLRPDGKCGRAPDTRLQRRAADANEAWVARDWLARGL